MDNIIFHECSIKEYESFSPSEDVVSLFLNVYDHLDSTSSVFVIIITVRPFSKNQPLLGKSLDQALIHDSEVLRQHRPVSCIL
jgi:hypothetical protein